MTDDKVVRLKPQDLAPREDSDTFKRRLTQEALMAGTRFSDTLLNSEFIARLLIKHIPEFSELAQFQISADECDAYDEDDLPTRAHAMLMTLLTPFIASAVRQFEAGLCGAVAIDPAAWSLGHGLVGDFRATMERRLRDALNSK